MPCSFTEMVFQDINMFAAPPAPSQDPMTDRHRWTIPVLSAWLNARIYTAPSKWKVGQLKEKVYGLMDRAQGAPPIQLPVGGRLSDIINLIIALSDMIGLLMTEVVTEEKCVRAEVLLKLFLSRLDRVDVSLYSHLDKFVLLWIKKSNFMGLLNLPSMMCSRGPVRLHWELGGRGERVIQDFKKIITTQQGRWAYIAHLKFLQLKALNKIITLIHNVVKE
jgi:hypothetical protein